MKKALKKLRANAQLLTIGFMLHSKEQLLDFSHPVQRKKNKPNHQTFQNSLTFISNTKNIRSKQS